ncbi:MAG TPA: hypothetical protein VFQ75_13610 [Candidatus Limnocylindrales bacterium]|nr:hypothetical protein [Candidatus Limnocylindrales bacterium]
MLLGHWHHCGTAGAALATHLHGRELDVVRAGESAPWHWRVASPHGALLAEGDAASCEAAEEAAEREALAVHPPTEALIGRLLA